MDAKRLIAVMVLCTILGPVGCRNSQSPTTVSEPPFPMVLNIGKDTTRDELEASYKGSTSYLNALEAASQSDLIDRVRQHCPFLNDEFEAENTWAVDVTLDWKPYQVFLVSRGPRSHQVILGTNDGRYHLIQLDLMSEFDAKLEVVQVAGQSVLAYSAGLGGNGGHKITGYFTLGQNGIPVEVEFDAAKGMGLGVLPKGFSVWSVGSFDLKKLQFMRSVWKPDDCHATPTGGRIRIEYELVGHTIIPKRYCYQPQYSNEQTDFADWESDNWGPFVDYPRD